jgi:hypothetical protein
MKKLIKIKKLNTERKKKKKNFTKLKKHFGGGVVNV